MKDNIKEMEEMEEDSLDEVKEVAVGKGLAGVLQLLKERGSLKETVDWGGRNMDKKKSKLVGIVDESNNVVGQRDILLDRVDEFGRTVFGFWTLALVQKLCLLFLRVL
jgi:U4/U6.U5 tri-snRNP-associated protein 1